MENLLSNVYYRLLKFLIIKNVIQKKKIQYLASRFAAKEAIAKALGIGIGKISFKNIEIKKKSSGAPYVNITNLTSLGLNTKIDIMISLSDEIDYTAAFVIINKKS